LDSIFKPVLNSELLDQSEVAPKNIFSDGGEVVFTFLELASSGSNEVGGGHGLGDVGYEKSHGRYVGGQSWLHTVGHIEWGIASLSANCSVVSSKDKWDDCRPL
jgi:hypothetical protein